MEYVKGWTLHDALELEKIPSGFKSDLERTFKHLHGGGYVFGDLRTFEHNSLTGGNIRVDRTSDPRTYSIQVIRIRNRRGSCTESRGLNPREIEA